MYSYIKHHFFQYFIILLLFAITVTALSSSSISFGLKILFIGVSIGVYFFWAIWHHWEDHALNWKVFFEYFLLAALLFWILLNLAK